MLTELSKRIYKANAAKGFWDERHQILDTNHTEFEKQCVKDNMLMLIVGELGEAQEAARKGRFADIAELESSIAELSKNGAELIPNAAYAVLFEEHVKDTFEDEIADVLIRLLDLCGGLNIDIGNHVDRKLQYNATRPFKHGKKF